jgi:hypothetical protein
METALRKAYVHIKKRYSQTSWPKNPEELPLHHDHEKFLVLTVLLPFIKFKIHH